jgi:hypothetical protein
MVSFFCGVAINNHQKKSTFLMLVSCEVYTTGE